MIHSRAVLAITLAAGLISAATTQPARSEAGQGTLTVVLETALGPIDPLKSVASLSTTTAMRHVFDTLVERTGPGQYAPRLAVAWTRPDDRSWRFELRTDARFHDGQAVEAADVVATVLALRDGKYPVSKLWSQLESATAVAPSVVELRTKEPVGTLLAAASLLYIAPRGAFDGERYAPDDKPVGSGPFRIESHVVDDHLALAANAEYWGEKPKIGKLVFREIPELTARITALTTGEVDLLVQIPGDQLEQLRGVPHVQVSSVPSYGIYFNWFNNDPAHRLEGGPADRNPFADVRVRRAMWHAVNAELIASTLLKDTAVPASAPVTRAVSGFSAQPPYAYDPDKAKQLLAEAGFAAGFNASIDISPRFVQSSPLAIAMISDWSAVGVRVMPRELEHSVWVDRLRAGKYDMTLAPNFAFTGDAEWSIGRLYVCANKRLGYCNERVDGLVGEASRAVDAQRRQALYEEINAILWQDAPSMWPFELVVNYAWRDRVSGIVPAPSQVPDFSRSVRVAH